MQSTVQNLKILSLSSLKIEEDSKYSHLRCGYHSINSQVSISVNRLTDIFYMYHAVIIINNNNYYYLYFLDPLGEIAVGHLPDMWEWETAHPQIWRRLFYLLSYHDAPKHSIYSDKTNLRIFWGCQICASVKKVFVISDLWMGVLHIDSYQAILETRLTWITLQ